jgi:hypothetical protein
MSMYQANVEFPEATHVQIRGRLFKIASKWGIDTDGKLATEAEGGCGVVTEAGLRVGIQQIQRFFKRKDELSN